MDRHKNRTLDSEAARKREERSESSDIAADLDTALAGIDWKRRRRAERDFLYFLKTSDGWII